MKEAGAKASPFKKRVADWAKSVGLQYNYSAMTGWDKGMFVTKAEAIHCPLLGQWIAADNNIRVIQFVNQHHELAHIMSPLTWRAAHLLISSEIFSTVAPEKNQQFSFHLFWVTGRIRYPGASCWLTIWSSRRCVLFWAWIAARFALQVPHQSPKTLWSISWASTCLWWNYTAWVKAQVHTPSPPPAITASQGQQHTWDVVIDVRV